MCRCACSWRKVEIPNPCDWDFLKPKNSRNHWHETIIHHHPPSSTIIHHHPPSSTIIHLLNRSWGSPMELRRHHFFSNISEALPERWFGYHDTNVFFFKKSNSRELIVWHIDTRNPAHNPWSANHRIAGLHWRRRGRGRTVDDSRSWFVAWGNVENWRCFAD